MADTKIPMRGAGRRHKSDPLRTTQLIGHLVTNPRLRSAVTPSMINGLSPSDETGLLSFCRCNFIALQLSVCRAGF